jgi:hypothetical protein
MTREETKFYASSESITHALNTCAVWAQLCTQGAAKAAGPDQAALLRAAETMRTAADEFAVILRSVKRREAQEKVDALATIQAELDGIEEQAHRLLDGIFRPRFHSRTRRW